eukprot:Gb_17336 [translate_table: standard]
MLEGLCSVPFPFAANGLYVWFMLITLSLTKILYLLCPLGAGKEIFSSEDSLFTYFKSSRLLATGFKAKLALSDGIEVRTYITHFFPHCDIVQKKSWKTVLTLSYQSLGVVFGDLSISPLYVYRNIFAEDIHHSYGNEEIYGVLSFVFWTLTLVTLFKYVFIVLRADDNGEVFRADSSVKIVCPLEHLKMHAKVSLLQNHQIADEELSTYKMELPPETKSGVRIKTMLEKHKSLHSVLLVVALLGTCMVIGDGVLTPALSGVFSRLHYLCVLCSLGP